MNISRLSHLAKRAVTASPQELAARLRQGVFVARNGLASLRGGSVFSPHAHLRSLRLQSNDLSAWWTQRDSKWSIGEAQVDLLREHASHAESGLPWVIEQADLVVSGRMPLFSFEPIDFTHRDRWHRDAILDKTAPRDFYGSVRYLDVDSVGDSKHTWEPNRFAWAIWLGIACESRATKSTLRHFSSKPKTGSGRILIRSVSTTALHSNWLFEITRGFGVSNFFPPGWQVIGLICWKNCCPASGLDAATSKTVCQRTSLRTHTSSGKPLDYTPAVPCCPSFRRPPSGGNWDLKYCRPKRRSSFIMMEHIESCRQATTSTQQTSTPRQSLSAGETGFDLRCLWSSRRDGCSYAFQN